MRPIVWEPLAFQEFSDALAASRAPAAFRLAVEEALQDIASGRVTHAEVPRTTARRCVLMRLPYSIVYTESANEIRVIALSHCGRRPGYWRNRLP